MLRTPKRRRALRRAIKARFPSMIAFAYAVNVSSSTLSRVVNGWETPSKERRQQWAEALGFSVSDLFPEDTKCAKSGR